MSERVDATADAVLAVPGVVGLSSDPDTVGAAESSCNGAVTTDADTTSVHVRVSASAPVGATAELVQRAATDVTGGRVDVTVEDIQ